jgi:hypothetical protein
MIMKQRFPAICRTTSERPLTFAPEIERFGYALEER